MYRYIAGYYIRDNTNRWKRNIHLLMGIQYYERNYRFFFCTRH